MDFWFLFYVKMLVQKTPLHVCFVLAKFMKGLYFNALPFYSLIIRDVLIDQLIITFYD